MSSSRKIMPEYEQKPNSGSAWINKYKEEDKHPDYTTLFEDENGNKKKIAIWDKTTRNGDQYRYFSISDYVPKESGKESPAWQKAREKLGPQEVPVAGTIEDDGTINYDEPINLDDIPF